MLPTPVLIDQDTIRIYLNCLDSLGRSRPTFIDVSADNPTVVLCGPDAPILDIGSPGAFDDNGVAVTSVVDAGDGRTFLYYAGFELLQSVRYRILTGLAISHDGGMTFSRGQPTPVLERTSSEALFRCGPFVLREDGVFKLWYIAGSSFEEVKGKALPVYDLRYQESVDGVNWSEEGQVSLELTDADEHGFGRPWVTFSERSGRYQMMYSIRSRSAGAYRLGYAESSDGINWKRKDSEMGLDVSDRGPDSRAICYSTFIEAHGKAYCFYNGNDFGVDGVLMAELISD